MAHALHSKATTPWQTTKSNAKLVTALAFNSSNSQSSQANVSIPHAAKFATARGDLRRPYAFLHDAPLEERRTQAVMARRWMSPEDASDLGRLDPEAIARVRAETWPEAENADELHDALVRLGFLTDAENAADPRWRVWLKQLAAPKRARRLETVGVTLWISAERAAQFRVPEPPSKLISTILEPMWRLSAIFSAWRSETSAVRNNSSSRLTRNS